MAAGERRTEIDPDWPGVGPTGLEPPGWMGCFYLGGDGTVSVLSCGLTITCLYIKLTLTMFSGCQVNNEVHVHRILLG